MSRVEVVMPKMGESVMEGTVIEWNKKVGDEVEVDETLLEIATDKVDSEVPCPDAGILVEILAEEGDTVEVGETIAVIETDKDQADASAESRQEAAPETESGEPEETEEEPSEEPDEEPAPEPEPVAQEAEEPSGSTTSESVPKGDTPPQRRGSDGRFFSPLVRSIAREEGVSQEELESIEGSGKGGRVSKKDILDYIEKRDSGEISIEEDTEEQPEAVTDGQAAREARKEEERAKEKADKESISAGELDIDRPEQDVEVIKMDRMRKMIAEHMVRSKQTAAHVTTFGEADVTNLVKWREANKEAFKKRTGVKLTFTPLFLEAVIQGIREYPLINSSVDGDEILVKKDINFGLAVALGEGGEGGLIVPVIKKAQEKNLEGLAKAVKELGRKARNKNLDPDDLVDGTITLTNYGSVGNLMGTPIINQPQVAILGTGAIQKKPVVKETDQGDVIAIRHMMYLSLSYDHRIIDGAHGGAFLNRVKELLENFDPNRAI